MKNNYDNELYKKYEELIVEVRETNKKINDLKLENHTLDTELASMKNKINVEVNKAKKKYVEVNKAKKKYVEENKKLKEELNNALNEIDRLKIEIAFFK